MFTIIPPNSPDDICWYRFHDTRTTLGSYISCHPYKVLRETPKGVWIDNYGREKFILRNARKRWACPTKEEALKSFHARKLKQVQILSSQLHHVERVLDQIENNHA